MAVYKRVEPAQGGEPIYRNETDNKVVKAEDVPAAVKEELDLAEAGTEIDEETVTQGEGDGEVTDSAGKPLKDTPEPANTGHTGTPAQEEEDDDDESEDPGEEVDADGMGFPRVKGKTVDIFDNKTPHEAVRLVDGVAVPLSQKNYETKTDSEILEKLNKLREKGKTRL